MIDANVWNFDAMKEAIGADPFADTTTKYGPDERFYTLTKDKSGNGAALIRFIPDAENKMIQKVFKINTTLFKKFDDGTSKKRFVSEFSPTTIGLPDPFQEKWQELYNAGNKEEAKLYSRGTRYITTIKVLKDPAKPENEGKIFWYEISATMKDKIQAAVNPSEQDRALGAVPKELFNPLKGNSFRLVAKIGANGLTNYDSSEVVNDITSIYNSPEEAFEEIKNNPLKLSAFLDSSFYPSYETLQNKMRWVTFQDAEVDSKPVEVQTPQKVEPEVVAVSTPVEAKTEASKSNSLEDMLKELV